MTVECPLFELPDMLEERGPDEDPTILLTGVARIGRAPAHVVAIRINNTLRWDPDFRRAVANGAYHAGGFDEILEKTLDELQVIASELEDILSDAESSVVDLATGQYRVFLIPASGRP
jgi:hypothetical protein